MRIASGLLLLMMKTTEVRQVGHRSKFRDAVARSEPNRIKNVNTKGECIIYSDVAGRHQFGLDQLLEASKQLMINSTS